METATPTTHALPVGTRIEEFVIGRVLGSGGFGKSEVGVQPLKEFRGCAPPAAGRGVTWTGHLARMPME